MTLEGKTGSGGVGTEQQSASSTPARVLMLTNVDRGEANVFLATCSALYRANPDVEIHFATLSGLEKDVEQIWEDARRQVPGVKHPIVYHTIDGPNMEDGLRQLFARRKTKLFDGAFPESFMEPLKFSVTMQAIKDMLPILTPFTGPQMVQLIKSIEGIIKKVDADVVLVDSLMTAGITAVWHLGVNWVVLSPNAIKEFATPFQKGAPGLWKFPASFTGFSYPVPWYQIPLNIFYQLYLVRLYLRDQERLEVTDYVKKELGADLKTPVNFLKNLPPKFRVWVGALPELDFPLVVPPHVSPCGPIVRSAAPVTESDPDTATWLSRGPTIYINLGSICATGEKGGVSMAKALRIVIDKCQKSLPGLQVLWKLKKFGEWEVKPGASEVYNILKDELEADRIRIVKWVTAEPMSILHSGHIVCSVHHGGANSYYESVISGVPQVILPQWTDTYDYAERVEFLGIGRLGSRTMKPQWSGPELSKALLDVLDSPQAQAIKDKAAELAAVCAQNGSGADKAAQKVLEECRLVRSAAVDSSGSSVGDKETV